MLTEVALVAISLVLVLVTWLTNRPKLPKTYPKGPPGWPVIGNLLQLGSQPHLKLTEWSRQYGAVFGLSLFRKRVVVLNSYKVLSEAFVDRKTDFAGRPRDFVTFEIATMGCKNITFMGYNELLKVLRKSVLTALRMHGTERWSEVITIQVDKLIDRFSGRGDSAFDPDMSLCLVAFNTVSELTQRQTYEEDDQEFIDFMDVNREIFIHLVEASPVDFAKWLRPFAASRLDRLKKAAIWRYKYMESRLRIRKGGLDRENPRDVIDMILIAQEDFQKTHTTDTSTEVFDDTVTAQMLLDILSAGSETMVTATKWFLIDLILHPEKQKKIHQEIDEVVGVDRRPVYADHDNLPYLKAAMYESLRLHSIVPLSVFHRTLCTTSVNGCHIPDDTLIIPNHWAIDHDPDVFKDPYVYRPERFIDPNTGRCASFNEMNFTPFGMGKRVCIGEMLAKVEYFLIAANLLHQFNVAVSTSHGKPSTEGELGLTYCPHPFKMTVKSRNVRK
ncbi:steroid 17-alpha-hydroxylase/17,20 lyase-like [Glandiceps talaboti]